MVALGMSRGDISIYASLGIYTVITCCHRYTCSRYPFRRENQLRHSPEGVCVILSVIFGAFPDLGADLAQNVKLQDMYVQQ